MKYVGLVLFAVVSLSSLALAAGLIGKAAPDFLLRTSDGQELRLQSLRGKPALVNFYMEA